MTTIDEAAGPERASKALAMLGDIVLGTMNLERFTADARWWWNGGLDLTVAEFSAILGRLHGQMQDGIRIVPGLVVTSGDRVIVEATTTSSLRDGRVYDNRYLFLVHFRGDRIDGVREYSDSAHVLATFDLSDG